MAEKTAGGDLVVAVNIAGERHFVITAKGLDALGLHELADRQRRESRARLEAKGLLTPPGGDEYDAPAGAGDEQEAYRG